MTSVEDIASKIEEITGLVKGGKVEERGKWIKEYKLLQDELKVAKAAEEASRKQTEESTSNNDAQTPQSNLQENDDETKS
ncbi:hypothetical protein GQ53DRAFT_839688 [Thozetella sp. PMI_491]|nr:hypothetical protein GQ53DRAFT_839688 [Thozetella sp. PMI_491]